MLWSLIKFIFSTFCVTNTFKSTLSFLLFDVCLRICEPQLSYIYVSAVVLLQFVPIMHTHPFALQVEPTIPLEMSPYYHQIHLAFPHLECLLPVLYLYRIKPVAWNLFTYFHSAVISVAGASKTFIWICSDICCRISIWPIDCTEVHNVWWYFLCDWRLTQWIQTMELSAHWVSQVPWNKIATRKLPLTKSR